MSDPITTQSLTALPAAAFRVSEGVAEGEPVTIADELVMDDIYQLAAGARAGRLTVVAGAAPGRFTLAEGTEFGRPGRLLVLDCCLTLMPRSGGMVEALVLVELDPASGLIEETYLLPLAPLLPRADYRLVGVDAENAALRLAEIASVAFTRGTHITLATGEQRRIEELRVGDRVLTRDDGPQPIRWISRTLLRAVGDAAPVVIRKGALHNEHDLIVSPDHRLFIWQREDRVSAGRPEVFVRARHLINGTSVYQRADGGFVEYYQLLFDAHQIIYAEGIAAESLLIDPRTRAALPQGGPVVTHGYRRHLAYDVGERLSNTPDAVERLRRASGAD